MSSPVVALTRAEAHLMTRNLANTTWLAVPVLAVVVLAVVPATRQPNPDWGGNSIFTLYQPILVVICLVLLSLMALPEDVAGYREMGYLRRLRATPARPGSLLAARAAVTLALQAVAIAAIVLVPLALGVGELGNPGGLVLALAAASAAMLGIGMLVAGLVPTRKSGTAVGTVLFFVLAFFAGLWMPRGAMPEVLLTISDATPTGAAVQAVSDSLGGAWPSALHLTTMAAWSLVLSALAVATFRWDGRRM